MQAQAESEIKGYECKHIMYSKAHDGSKDDLLTIKENIHYNDGRVVPNLRFIKNYKRPFWITREGYRTHRDKLEWEEKSRLQRFTCTQANLINRVSQAIDFPGFRGSLRQLCRNPYIYGADIAPEVLVKKKYMMSNPDCLSLNTVAAFDIETDVVEGHEAPIYAGLTYRGKAFLGVSAAFVRKEKNVVERLQAMFEEYLGEFKEKREIELEIQIFESVGEMIHVAFKKAHEWQPDFISIWNIDFDVPRIVAALEAEGFDPADTFSDPKVPERFRYFKYTKGKTQKTTAAGLVLPIPVDERWHTVECPASFHFIDPMCVYRRIRLAKQREPSYSLDYQLKQHVKLGKLRFKEADKYDGLDWHVFMQKYYKLEYGIYNLFDCIALELFDEKLKDLAQTLSVQVGPSTYNSFKSQPSRLVDNLFFFCLLEKNRVLATASDQMMDELDKLLPDRNGWVITLPSHQRVKTGLKVIRELPDVTSEIHIHTCDADVAAGYPTGQKILNLSKETTFRELCRIRGIPLENQKLASVNLIGGHVNAVEIVEELYQAPTFNQLLEGFQHEIENGNV